MNFEDGELTAVQAEKVRMCLAEAGYVDGVDGELVFEPYDGVRYGIWWRDTKTSSRAPSEETLWRARELAGLTHPVCLRHFESWNTEMCQAARRLMRDCGS